MDPQEIAFLIISGFRKHYSLFQDITAQVPHAFATQQWHVIEKVNKSRISHYDERVADTVKILRLHFNSSQVNTALWFKVKQAYIELLTFHPQAELAETFYNSVFCQLFHHSYFNNNFIFVTSSIEDTTTLPVEAEYRSYFPVVDGLKPTIYKIISNINFACEFNDLEGDIRLLQKAFIKQAPDTHHQHFKMRFDILKSPFYRNKSAYIVGRVISSSGTQPFIIAVLHHPNGKLKIDALVTNGTQMSLIFGFARAYFLVETHAPSALVSFLNQLMPSKTQAELYNSIGFHKHGKTEFYRAFLHHQKHNEEQFCIAPGTPGMVMLVFTLPTFPYVFKVIKEHFAESKPFGRNTVLARYQLVKNHDRVGRMADTLEYSNVVIKKSQIEPQLLELMREKLSNSIIEDSDFIVIKHLYIERRITPLNLYLQNATDEETEYVIDDYGHAIKEMLHVNIFPGDMLLKNFGVSRHKRVIFYDYDEVQYLTEMNFKALPKTSLNDLYCGESALSFAPNDVFPEQLCTFVLTNPKLKAIFERLHPELLTPDYWQQAQRDIQQHKTKHVFPYPQNQRFGQQNKNKGSL
ncbi:bifunctional isocitrate dehydrogenase kinase/phosphatase [Pseudoalteromonas luteoviolacea]|uniref:bifunctional isocitrate dehydrogenase kinase/phosphatase n=1 Tax=Pseudoalteromonas luteoviolacea TaxID=43657 RepID=UPI001B358E04|nr:bifunctional isocitrate dehydrogenase kinase/phosphatase [Pseudoalteromonas luteoviolacea]MBQ4810966.1 bifunctional isocitrate dehydrogenase kinase/phosphatase [Pseudoalteromonas luteoviolacea]